MDLASLAIGGVGIAGLIIAIVEGLKTFGVNGKKSKAAAFILGFFFAAVSLGTTDGIIPAAYVPYIELFVRALSVALASTGGYDFLRKNFGKNKVTISR